jgi:hypothetical protein
MTLIPIDPNGYAVNPATGTVHTRYAGAHAGLHYRTRTVKGVEHYLDGRKPKVCELCYPSPRYPEPPRPVQQRRVPVIKADTLQRLAEKAIE